MTHPTPEEVEARHEERYSKLDSWLITLVAWLAFVAFVLLVHFLALG